jgi:hypothetical protein
VELDSDETRDVSSWGVAATIKDHVSDAIDRARIDPWQGDAPFIICESRSLRGALTSTAYGFAVPITSTNGQCGGFLHTDVGPTLRPGQHVLYLGDLDRGGGDIEGNAREVLEDIVGKLDWERLALTQAQADANGLEPMSRYDGRDKKYHDAIETEALGQTAIVKILRDRLEELLPEPLEVVTKREERQRRQILKLLQRAA